MHDELNIYIVKLLRQQLTGRYKTYIPSLLLTVIVKILSFLGVSLF